MQQTTTKFFDVRATLMFLPLWLVTGCVGDLNLDNQVSKDANNGVILSNGTAFNGARGATLGSVSFDASPPSVYVAKVKAILANAVPTDAELQAVQENPANLQGLIKTWMQTPQYETNRRRFFQQAFQQKPAISYAENYLGVPPDPNVMTNLHESFARTVEANIDAGLPLNYSINTNQFMMTTALMIFYGVQDSINVTGLNSSNSTENANLTYTFTPRGPFALSDTLNPQSPNYMVWSFPAIARANQPRDCYAANGDDVLINIHDAFGRGDNLTAVLYHYIYGVGFQTWADNGDGNRCFFHGTPPTVLKPSDFTDWRMVTVRPPNPGETADNFWEIIKLRSANQLLLNLPRVGPFTTPPFIAQYSSNQSNQARVTTNQTMIITLNHAFDGSTLATPGMNMAALDANHAAPGSACYSCHQTLDPMRQFFLKQYNFYLSPQTTQSYTTLSGWFDYDGVSVPGNTINDFATLLANHPSFAVAWTEKFCNFVNSVPCDPQDPELQSVAAQFKNSNFNWNTLVVALMSSPLVTYAAPTLTTQNAGQAVSIARQWQICSNLSARLNIPDICGLADGAVVPSALLPVQAVAAALPTDQYSRGATVLPLVVQPGLIYRSSLENFCATLATYLVSGSGAIYSTNNIPQSLNTIGIDIIGLTPQTEAPVVALLQTHYNNALAAKATPSVALESTVMLACLSPMSIGVGLGL